MKEVWKNVEEFENYQVSNLGRVRNVKSGKILKLEHNKVGYQLVTLSKDGKPKRFRIHRLVAMAFISNPHNKPEVNHLDEIKNNNNVTNLEWCTRSYNANYGSKVKPVLQFDLNNRYVREFKSIIEVNRKLGFDDSSIVKCCKGKRKTAHNFIWKYKEG